MEPPTNYNLPDNDNISTLNNINQLPNIVSNTEVSDLVDLSDSPVIRRRRKIEHSMKELLIRQVVKKGKKITEAADFVGINLNTAKSIIKNFKDNGEIVKDKRGGARRILLNSEVLSFLDLAVELNSSITINQLKDIMAAQGFILSKSTVENGLKKLMITLKKARRELDRVNCPDIVLARRNFALDFSRNAPIDRRKCIFVDECGFNLHLSRSQARSRKGTRAPIVIPTVRGRNITLISAMSSAGLLHSKIIDDGTCTSSKFLIFMEELKTVLNNRGDMEGAMILMDNAKIHSRNGIENLLLTTTYALKFLSPYSYMLNPIEYVFSKIKITVRRILTELRTSDFINIGVERNLNEIIMESVSMVTIEDCNGYLVRVLRNYALAAAGERYVD